MHTAGRTSSTLGFNTRQSAGFDAVAHVLPGGSGPEHVDFTTQNWRFTGFTAKKWES